MLINCLPYNDTLSILEIVNSCSITTVDSKLWVTYAIGINIYIIRTLEDGSWSSPTRVVTGTNPTITYDGSQVLLYFENGGKIQRLEMLVGELGLPVSPLQLWDALDPRFKGVTVKVNASRLVFTGLQYVSAGDDWPDFQPVPGTALAEGYRLSWTDTPNYPGTRHTFNVYENDVLILENTTSLYMDIVVKANAVYKITTIYTLLAVSTESRPRIIETPFQAVAEETFYPVTYSGRSSAKIPIFINNETDSASILDYANVLDFEMPLEIKTKVRSVANYEAESLSTESTLILPSTLGKTNKQITIHSLESSNVI